MYRPLSLITVGSVAAVGALVVASALPAGAATAGRDDGATTCSTTVGAANGVPCSVPGPDLTPVTFSITSTGVLAITAPDGTPTAIDLGTVVSGTTIQTLGAAGNFGAVTVDDSRALDPADWTATVSSTDFANVTTGVAADIIPATAATYTIPAITADTPSGLPLPGTGLPPDGVIVNNAAAPGIAFLTASGASDVVTVTGVDGDSSATWSPTITVTIPANAVAGTYTGTVTHSVT